MKKYKGSLFGQNGHEIDSWSFIYWAEYNKTTLLGVLFLLQALNYKCHHTATLSLLITCYFWQPKTVCRHSLHPTVLTLHLVKHSLLILEITIWKLFSNGMVDMLDYNCYIDVGFSKASVKIKWNSLDCSLLTAVFDNPAASKKAKERGKGIGHFSIWHHNMAHWKIGIAYNSYTFEWTLCYSLRWKCYSL